jgi:predicted flap endonuclease-1-like 5' DNA nuclease
MAAAAAAAIAAASASVTRGLKPIEPISPLAKVDPKISMPAKLSDAIKEKGAAAALPEPANSGEPIAKPAAAEGPADDLKRIRGIGVLIEKRLNGMGVTRYDQIANWTSGDIDRVSRVLEFKGRIERESWVEQARILSSGGQTEFSRRVDRGEVDTSRDT